MRDSNERDGSNPQNFSRRTALRGGAGLLVATSLIAWADPAPALASPLPSEPTPDPQAAPVVAKPVLSANGWPVQKSADSGGDVWTKRVEGAGFSLPLCIGGVAPILLHVVRRFHYEIETLAPGEVVAFKPLGLTSRKSPDSNHASGTAVTIRQDWYPAGSKGGFFRNELTVIRDILAECDGAVRWGGDDAKRPNEALFYIDVRPDDPRIKDVSGKLFGWNFEPGAGAGSHVDPFATNRRKLAKALEAKQR